MAYIEVTEEEAKILEDLEYKLSMAKSDYEYARNKLVEEIEQAAKRLNRSYERYLSDIHSHFESIKTNGLSIQKSILNSCKHFVSSGQFYINHINTLIDQFEDIK